MGHWVFYDTRPMIPGTPAMGIDVLNANGNRASHPQRCIKFGLTHFPNRHRSFSNIQLHAVVANTEPHSKSERITQPRSSLIHILISQHWYYGGTGYRSIRQHSDQLCHSIPCEHSMRLVLYIALFKSAAQRAVFGIRAVAAMPLGNSLRIWGEGEAVGREIISMAFVATSAAPTA